MKVAFKENFNLRHLKIGLEVIGIPRLSTFRAAPASQNKGIVFFSFDILEKFRHLGLENKHLEDLQVKVGHFYDTFCDFVIQHPEVPVTVKTKSNKKFLNSSKTRLSKILHSPNVRFTSKGSSLELLNNNCLAIGFNSTTLVEAMLANRHIISFRLPDDTLRCMFHGSPMYDVVCPPPEKLMETLENHASQLKKPARYENKKWLKDRVGYFGQAVLKKI